MIASSTVKRLVPLLALAFATGLVCGCSDRSADSSATGPDGSRSAALATVENLEAAEELTEAVTGVLLEWSDALARGADEEVASALSADFRGADPHALSAPAPSRGPLGVTLGRASAAAAPRVDAAGFVAGLRTLLDAFDRVDSVEPKVVRAEFATGEPTGVADVRLLLRGAKGVGPLARTLTFRARVREGGGTWRLERVDDLVLEEVSRAAPLYTDVTRRAGVAHRGPRFGTEGNDSFFWEGAASADVDGDGRFDLFVPSDGRNFLYLNRGDGTFEDVAEAAGVASPGDGTAALLLDADHDGAVDVLVGHAGLVHRGERIGGPTRLHRNVTAPGSGEGPRFEDVGEAAGFDALHVTFSLAAADADLDGFVDVHFACYNAEGLVAPDSWHEASNGTANALYFGDGSGRFVDRAEESGVADRRWSYAAAFCDFDEDGDQDLYVANDYAPNAMWLNRGDGTFEDATVALGVEDVGNGMGVTWGDHDADGDLDLYVANMSAVEADRVLERVLGPPDDAEDDALATTVRKLAAGNTLFTWTGERFEVADVGATDARWAWSAQFDDVDLDGDEDLLCVNGFLSGPSPRETLGVYWRHVVASTLPPRDGLYLEEAVNSPAYQDRQMGPVFGDGLSFAGHERDKVWLRHDGRYVDVSLVSGADDANDGRALVLADLDDDGDRDVFVHHSQLERHRLYRNDAPAGTGHRSVKVRLVAVEGPAEAMGAIVRARTGERTVAQVLAYGSGFLSQNAPELSFGVGAAEAADEVVVRWPGRAVESFGRLEAGRTWRLVEGTGRPVEVQRRPIDLGG